MSPDVESLLKCHLQLQLSFEADLPMSDYHLIGLALGSLHFHEAYQSSKLADVRVFWLLGWNRSRLGVCLREPFGVQAAYMLLR